MGASVGSTHRQLRQIPPATPHESRSAHLFRSLPNVQITSGTNLRDRLFARDRHTKSPRDWVDPDADLVVIQLEPGAPKHDGITAGIIDAINRCEVLRVPVWLVGEAKWKYGPKHTAQHKRINDWLETAREFDFTSTAAGQ